MSEFNQKPKSDALENLENMILESFNYHQKEKEDEFNRLQEILVDPELLKMRDRMVEAEKEISGISPMREKINRLEKDIKDISIIPQQLESVKAKIQEIQGGNLNNNLDTIIAKIKEIQALKIAERLVAIEANIKIIEDNLVNSKDIVKIIVPILSSFVNRQLNQFKEEIVNEITAIIKHEQEERKKISICVRGIPSPSKIEHSNSITETKNN
jgi:hypothetical protein